MNQGSASLRAVYHVDDHIDLKSISSVGGFDLNPVWYDNDGEAALIQKNLIHYQDGYFTQELQVNGHYKALTFATGAFYLHERFYVQRDGYSRKNSSGTDPALDPANYSTLRAHNTTTTDSFALFGEANLKVTDWATLTGGLRETIEAKSFHFDNKNLNLNGDVTGQSIQGDASDHWGALTPKVSVAFQYGPTTLHYLTYSRGLQVGRFRQPCHQHRSRQAAVQPGVRQQLRDRPEERVLRSPSARQFGGILQRLPRSAGVLTRTRHIPATACAATPARRTRSASSSRPALACRTASACNSAAATCARCTTRTRTRAARA